MEINQLKNIDKKVKDLITYDKLWAYMEDNGITQYDLYTYHGINRYTLDRLRHNKNIETFTLNKICKALKCDISEIMEYIPFDED